ncbi:MAG: SRPBCC family protein, partial [Streptosporangiaceae bacterium]
ADVGAPIKRVWDALQDRDVLARAIPGCSRLETPAEGAYHLTVTARVASVEGPFTGEVRVTEQRPPYALTASARAHGTSGSVEATVEVTLHEVDAEHTKVDYDADARVDGEIAGIGQLLLVGQAKRTAGEFFGAVERTLTGAPGPARRPGRMEMPTVSALSSQTFDAVCARLGGVASVDPRLAFAGGAALGAGIALAGVGIVARRRAKR